MRKKPTLQKDYPDNLKAVDLMFKMYLKEKKTGKETNN